MAAKMKWMLALVGLLALPLFVAACGSSSDDSGSDGGDKASEGGVKTALVAPCDSSDPWCAPGIEATDKLASEGVIDLESTLSAPQDTAGVTQILNQYAEGGTELVIGYSTWQDASAASAKANADTDFATFGWETMDNMAVFDEPIYQAAYLAGILAAGITKSNTIAGLAGQDVPLCHAEMEAFRLGAETMNDKVKMLVAYVGDWNDPAKSKQAVEAQNDQGADVFIACGGAQANGMAQVLKQRNLSGFGYVYDTSSQAPKNFVGTVIYDPYPYIKAMAEDVKNDSFRPAKTYSFGMADDGVRLDLNDGFGVAEIPEKNMKEMEKVQSQIMDGSFEVPYKPGDQG